MSSASVLMWITYARTVMGRLVARPGDLGVHLTRKEIDAFEYYLNEWEDTASADPVFHWRGEAPADEVRGLMDTWIRMADGLSEEERRRGFALQPPEGQEFNNALIIAVLTALGDAEANGD